MWVSISIPVRLNWNWFVLSLNSIDFCCVHFCVVVVQWSKPEWKISDALLLIIFCEWNSIRHQSVVHFLSFSHYALLLFASALGVLFLLAVITNGWAEFNSHRFIWLGNYLNSQLVILLTTSHVLPLPISHVMNMNNRCMQQCHQNNWKCGYSSQLPINLLYLQLNQVISLRFIEFESHNFLLL